MSSSVETIPSLHCQSETDVTCNAVSAFCAFESQLRTLCLDEFPCGLGNWRCDNGSPTNKTELGVLKSARLLQKYNITERDYGAQHEMTETLAELASSRFSPWKLNYDWSDEAKSLRELAIKSPWIINDNFVCNHFRSLRIVDKEVTGVDEKLLLFRNLESLTLTANYIQRVDSRFLPRTLKILELCANEIDVLEELCLCPPPLVHLGLGFNRLASLGPSFVGPCWPELRSLDLSNNDIVDLWSVIDALQSLPKLRNLVLVGNPFTLVPGYRGYTIDTLKKLDFLDDIGVTVDEKHYFRCIANMTDCNISDARIRIAVPLLKGVLPPEEIANPDDLPEFPKISTRYLVQFMFFRDTCYEYDEEAESLVATTSHISAVAPTLSRTKPNERSRLKLTEQPVPAMVKPIDPAPTETSPSGLPLIGVRTLTSEWAEEMPMNWGKTLVIGDLRQLRDFCKEGVNVTVIEEKVLSSPPPEEVVEMPNSATKVGADRGKSKEKDASPKGKPKSDAKAGKTDGKKKKGEQEPVVPLIASPPVYKTLASFHIPLTKYVEGDFGVVESKLVHEHPQPVKSPESEIQVQDKKDKDKKHPAAAASGNKNNAKGPGGKDKDKKGKARLPGAGDDDGVIPPMEVHVTIKLCHWKTTADVTKSIGDL